MMKVLVLPLCIYICYAGVMGGNIQGDSMNKTLRLGFTAPWSHGWPIGYAIAAGLIVGLDEIDRRQLLPGHDIQWIWRDSYCQPKRGMQVAVDMWHHFLGGLDAIIGDGCSSVCQPQSLLAAAWRIPVISWGCTSGSLSNKAVYPTFTRVDTVWTSFAPAYNSLADTFGWKIIALLTIPNDLYRQTASAIKTEMERHGKHVLMQVFDDTMRGDKVDKHSMTTLRQTLIYLKSQTRVIIMMATPEELRNILVIALEEGMLNGEFAFCGTDYHGLIDIIPVYRPNVSNDVIIGGLLAMIMKEIILPQEFYSRVVTAFADPQFEGFDVAEDVEGVHMYAGIT